MDKDEFKKQFESNTLVVVKEESELNKHINAHILDDNIYEKVLNNSRKKYNNSPNYLLFKGDGKIPIGHITSCNNIKDILTKGRLVASDLNGSFGKGV